MENLIRIGLLLCNIVFKLIPKVWPQNPEILERRCYKKHRTRIDKLVAAQAGRSEDARLARGNQKLLALGNRFAFRANLVWGRSRIDEYRAAWFNVLAAEAYREAQNHKQAGGFFHFAAHDFRGVGEYAIAGRYYCESAKEFKQGGDNRNAIRACQRGLACFHQVCDDLDPTFREMIRLKGSLTDDLS
ncbi:MAG: hypothetical protein WA117_21250 [Verrucomicrobiia bacterium]